MKTTSISSYIYKYLLCSQVLLIIQVTMKKMGCMVKMFLCLLKLLANSIYKLVISEQMVNLNNHFIR